MGGGASAQGPQRAARGFGRTGQGGAQVRARRCRFDRDGDADFQRGAEIAARDHHRLRAFRGRRQGQTKATCCSRSMHARSTPRSSRPKACSPRTRRSSRARSATSARYTDLVGKGATTQVNVDNAKTQSDILIGTIKADQSALDNLKVQKSFTTDPRAVLGADQRRQCEGRQFRASGRYRAARRHQPDGAGLCDLRHSAARAGRSARGHGARGFQGDRDDPGPSAFRGRQGRDGRKHRGFDHRHGHRARHHGQRATRRCGRARWCNTSSSSAPRTRSTVPTAAVQRSQSGNFVFVVKDGKAHVQPVKVSRTFQGMSVIAKGLSGGERRRCRRAIAAVGRNAGRAAGPQGGGLNR